MIEGGRRKQTKARSKAARKARKRASARFAAKTVSLAPAGSERFARARERRTEPDVGPTPERMAKPDFNARENCTEDTLARLFRLQRLDDKDKDRNRQLAKAGVIYQQAAYKAGLVGISAQDLLRIPGRDEGADPKAVATRKVQRAVDLMGVRVASAVHAVLVDGLTIEDVGRVLTARKRERDVVVAGMTTLQNGLSILAEKEAAWA